MISIIYGAKGSGKTKQIIDKTNKALETAKGDIVFMTDTNQYSREIKLPVRYVDCSAENIRSRDEICGFVKGMLAANHDIEHIYIDGLSRLTDSAPSEMKDLFDEIGRLTNSTGCNFTVTISAELEKVPDFIAKYII